MDTFKKFYNKDRQIEEGLGDLLGDVKANIIAGTKKAISNVVPQGVKDVAKRLWNVENDIIKLVDEKQFKNLGKLFIEKQIPQNFNFKRLTLFGKNVDFNAPKKTYNDVPLFFGIISRIIDNNMQASIKNIFGEIESGGVDITTYLNRLNTQKQDILTFILSVTPSPEISTNPVAPSEYEKMCANIVSTMLTFQHTPIISNDLAVHTAIRMKSLPILKAFFENKYPVKLNTAMEQTADKIGDPNILSYIETLKGGKMPATPSSSSPLDFSKYGYDPKATTLQQIKQPEALVMLAELANAMKKPIEKTKLANISKNKALIKAGIITRLNALKLPANIEIV